LASSYHAKAAIWPPGGGHNVVGGALGWCVAKFRTYAVEAVWLLGMITMGLGAWFRSPPTITVGIMVVVAAWSYGPAASQDP
jgi:hypothetical protein